MYYIYCIAFLNITWISRKYNELQILFIKLLNTWCGISADNSRLLFNHLQTKQNKKKENEEQPPFCTSQSTWRIWSPYLNPRAVVQGLVSFKFQMDLLWLVSGAVDALILWRAVCWSPHVAASTWRVQQCENMGKWKQREEGEMREEWGK